jgi:hypothetical protein
MRAPSRAFARSTQPNAQVHGDEPDVFADEGYQGVGKPQETQVIQVNSHVAMLQGKRKVPDKSMSMAAMMDKLE